MSVPVARIVHIVDDDAAVRRTLERLLVSAGFEVHSYSTAGAFMDAAASLIPGCILLDVRMPGTDGLELQARLSETGILIPIIMMTAQGDVQTAVRAMKAGAVEFVEKPYDDDVLIASIEAALASVGGASADREAADAVRRIAMLSPREREVLEALMAGRSNKVIAFDLGISVRTVEVHRARMMDRLGVRQLAEAVRLAVLAKLAAAHPPAGGRRR
jgi:two-component system, LuxR family, response regulator FixJ